MPQQPFVANADASKSVSTDMSTASISDFHSFIKRQRGNSDEDVRQNAERLLLRETFPDRRRGDSGSN